VDRINVDSTAIPFLGRMREFYEYYLMGKPAPKWLKEGIPHLKMKEHIKKQSKKAKRQKSPREK